MSHLNYLIPAVGGGEGGASRLSRLGRVYVDVVGVLRLAGGGKGCCVCCRASYLVCVAEGVWLGVFLLAFLCCCWWRDEHLTVYGVMWVSRLA